MSNRPMFALGQLVATPGRWRSLRKPGNDRWNSWPAMRPAIGAKLGQKTGGPTTERLLRARGCSAPTALTQG